MQVVVRARMRVSRRSSVHIERESYVRLIIFKFLDKKQQQHGSSYEFGGGGGGGGVTKGCGDYTEVFLICTTMLF